MLLVKPQGTALIRALSFFNCLLVKTMGLHKSKTAIRSLSAGNFHTQFT